MKTIVEYLVSNHIKNTDYVDLALSSGTLWAKMNIGATDGKKPEDWYGLYFAWGETKGYKATDKHEFGWYAYKFDKDNDLIKYNKQDKLNQLEYKDDAVYKNTNGKYRMPTNDEFNELIKYTDNKWFEDYNGIHGLNGRLFIGKNGNTLFIPAAGYWIGYNVYFDNEVNSWSSIINSNDPIHARNFYSNTVDVGIGHCDRCIGLAVRGC